MQILAEVTNIPVKEYVPIITKNRIVPIIPKKKVYVPIKVTLTK